MRHRKVGGEQAMAKNGGEARGPVERTARPSQQWDCRRVHAIVEIWPVVEEIAGLLQKAGFGPREVFAARLSLEEAISNGVRHGNRNDPEKTVHIRFNVSNAEFHAEIEDEGPGFDPQTIPDPLAPENIQRPGGRGILLIRSYMAQADYNDRGNCLRMCLRRK